MGRMNKSLSIFAKQQPINIHVLFILSVHNHFIASIKSIIPDVFYGRRDIQAKTATTIKSIWAYPCDRRRNNDRNQVFTARKCTISNTVYGGRKFYNL